MLSVPKLLRVGLVVTLVLGAGWCSWQNGPSTKEPSCRQSPRLVLRSTVPWSSISCGLHVHFFSFHRFTQNLSIFRRDVAEALRNDGHTELCSLDMMS